MKIGKMIGAACAVGLAFAVPVQSLSAQSETWTLARAGNGAFSIETPCTAGEIAAFASVAADVIKDLNLVPGTQIVCPKGQLLIMAGVIETDELPAGVPTYFDKLSAGMPKGNGMAGTPQVTMFAGRRAIVNRALKDGVLAQTTVLEVGPKRVIMLLCGFHDTDLAVAAQGQTLDRFFASFKVTGQ